MRTRTMAVDRAVHRGETCAHRPRRFCELDDEVTESAPEPTAEYSRREAAEHGHQGKRRVTPGGVGKLSRGWRPPPVGDQQEANGAEPEGEENDSRAPHAERASEVHRPLSRRLTSHCPAHRPFCRA